MELQTIKNKIYQIRNQKVILDFDLSALYETETRALKQAVNRNIGRFPEEFLFQLTQTEWPAVLTNSDSLSPTAKFSPSRPYAFVPIRQYALIKATKKPTKNNAKNRL